MNYKTYRIGGSTPQPQNPFSSLWSLVVMAAVIAVLFYVIKGLVNVLYWAAPILLILALVVNHKVVLNYANQLIESFKTNILRGIIGVVVLVFGYPFVFAWLLVKALFMNRLEKAKQNFGQNLNQEFQENPFSAFSNFRQNLSKQKDFEQRPNKSNDEEWAEYEEIK
jgi:hypothetical protein